MPRLKPIHGPDGTEYPSRAGAAKSLGVHISTITWHLRKYGDLQMLGTWAVACEYRGRRFASLADCARAIGVARHTLTNHLNVHGNLDRAGRGRPQGNPGNRGRRHETKIGPLTWPRRMDAAEELGISRTSLSRWIGPKATPAQREKLLALAMQAQARRLREAG